MKRTPIKRRSRLKPGKRKRRKPQPLIVLEAIAAMSYGRCIGCGKLCDWRRDRHHVLPVSSWPQYELEPRNQVLACLDCHMNHEAASRRFRYGQLPAEVVTFLRSQGGREALALERAYPR